MGQGYSMTTLSAGSAGIDVPELVDLSYEKSLGDARFMKTVRARHTAGLVVAKVVMKPYLNMKLDRYIAAIANERRALEDIPNALSFHRAFETANHAYLLRQYTYSSLYDRMSTRPFLEDVEKRWLAFQLLTAVKECHAKEIYHGDIKTENCLVTSWNWLFLSDFSGSFKPVYLPEDNPADFSFYFDISGRRTCYLAPERFLSPGEVADEKGSVTWAMDIFSVGCVIAELFCEGPIFNLSQLFNYRSGEYNPMREQIKQVEDPEIRELVAHMIQLEPESRYSADEYLNFWRGKAFPEYFYSFLHQYMFLITDPTSGKTAITSDKINLGESDDRIARVYNDFDKIAYFLDYDTSSPPMQLSLTDDEPFKGSGLFPIHVNIPHRRRITSAKRKNAGNDGTFLFLDIVTSSIRSTARASARLQACDLLLAFAEHVPDEAKLDRILPFVVTMLDDRSDVVKVAALRTLAQLLSIIRNASPVNAYIFPEYIIPKLNDTLNPKRGKKPGTVIRIAYAQCIAPLAESAARFLDSIQALRREGSLPSVDPDGDESHIIHAYQDYYDIARADLVRFFEAQTRALLTDSDSGVRRAFLGSITSLCLFFGSSKTNDAILSHLNTYLNDKDWELKCAFFDAIVGVAIYVGSSNLEDFILPLMVLALTDPEEFVIDRVIRSLSRMAELGLFQRSKTWDLLDLVGRFTMHPSLWVREAAAGFLASATRYVTTADLHCLVWPLISPYFRMMPKTFAEVDILDVLKKPLPRAVYATTMTWAQRSERGVYWKTVDKRAAAIRLEERLSAIPSREIGPNAFSKFPKNDEDQQWVKRLRDVGMNQEDEFKVLALSESIWRIIKRTNRDSNSPESSVFNSQVELSNEQLKEVAFDTSRRTWEDDVPAPDGPASASQDRPQTIADALLDASTTIGQHDARRVSTTPLPGRPSDRAQSSRQPNQNSPTPSDLQPLLTTQRDTQGPQPSRHKNASMNLMQREHSGGKAIAATSTTSENAFGKVEGSTPRDSSSQPSPAPPETDLPWKSTSEIRYKAGAAYKGRDPNVIKLLGSIYLDNTPTNMAEFGSSIKPIEQILLERRGPSMDTGSWKPSGTMIATFNEHTGPITRILPAPDHSFFLTASEDGSVKIWDTVRLERNIAHRSRQTYRLGPGIKITALSFVGRTLSFVVTGNDGSIHCLRTDRVISDQSTTKYNKLRLIRQWMIPGASKCYPVWAESVVTMASSFLLVATSASQVHAMDLRTGSVIYTLENPVQHGTPTTFCLGPSPHHWLLLGTAHGMLDLWDLRFRVRLRSFAFPAGSPIHRITLHPAGSDEEHTTLSHPTHSNVVYVAGGTGAADITAWDLQELKCIEVYRTASAAAAHGQSQESLTAPKSPASPQRGAAAISSVTNLDLRPYTAWNPDTASRSSLLSRFGASQSPGSDDTNNTLKPNAPTQIPSASQQQPDRGCRALLAGVRYTITSDGPLSKLTNGAVSLGEAPPYLMTAGPGAEIRFWDLKDESSISQSCIVSGEDEAIEDGPPVYEVVGRKSGTIVSEERYPKIEAEDGGASVKGSSKTAKDKRKRDKGKRGDRGLGRELLLQRHLDAVMDLAVVELPYRMVVSGDRSGVIFVWA